MLNNLFHSNVHGIAILNHLVLNCQLQTLIQFYYFYSQSIKLIHVRRFSIIEYIYHLISYHYHEQEKHFLISYI